jgi:hypothetical protein
MFAEPYTTNPAASSPAQGRGQPGQRCGLSSARAFRQDIAELALQHVGQTERGRGKEEGADYRCRGSKLNANGYKYPNLLALKAHF